MSDGLHPLADDPPLPDNRSLLVILAHVVLYVVTFGIAGTHLAWLGTGVAYELAESVLFGLLVGQAAVVGVWLAIGTNHWPARLCGWTATVAALSGPLIGSAGLFSDPMIASVGALIAGSSALLASLLITARGLGFRLQHRPAKPRKRPFQFSLRDVLLLMSVAAVVFAAARHLHAIDLPLAGARMAVGLASVVSVALAALWATLGRGHPTRRCAVVFLWAAVAAPTMAFCLYYRGLPILCSMLVLESTAMVVVATLLVFRRAGYRLVRKGPTTTRKP